MTRPIAALLIFLGGIALCRSGYLRLHERSDSPENSGVGEIVAHAVALDLARWNGGKQYSIAVETRVRSGAGESASRRFFETAAGAWEFTLNHPEGERVDVSKLGNGDDVASTGKLVFGGIGMILCGGLVGVLGLALATKGESFAVTFYLARSREGPVPMRPAGGVGVAFPRLVALGMSGGKPRPPGLNADFAVGPAWMGASPSAALLAHRSER